MGYEAIAGATAGEVFGHAEARGAAIAVIVADDRADDGTTGGEQAVALATLARRTIPTVVLGGEAADTPGMIQIPKPLEPIRLRDLLETMIRIAR